jgi:hypothetical protein
MFPLLADTVCGVRDDHCGETAGGYLGRISVLAQAVAMAQQLRNDAVAGATQKYLAHQMALLYVRLPN